MLLPSEKVSLILPTQSNGRNERKHHKSLPNAVSELCLSPFYPLSIRAGGARVLKREKSGAKVLKDTALGKGERGLGSLPTRVDVMPYITANNLQALNK